MYILIVHLILLSVTFNRLTQSAGLISDVLEKCEAFLCCALSGYELLAKALFKAF